MSEHTAEVIEVKLEPHENADSLSKVLIGGFTVIVRSSDWINRSRGIYVKPDTICNTDLEPFSFLKKDGKQFHRVKVVKLRGCYSQGLLIPCDELEEIGKDFYSELQLSHYDPEIQETNNDSLKCGRTVKEPEQFCSLSRYDVENLRSSKIRNQFVDNEMVGVFEKLNGSNISVFYDGEKFHVKSRNFWKEESDSSDFWKGLHNTPQISQWCINNPNMLVRGELIGKVGGFPYDSKGKPTIRVFDILRQDRSYLSCADLVATCNFYMIPMAPFLGFFPFEYETLLTMAEMNTKLGNHIAEGLVIRPTQERWNERIGRVIGKIVSNQYLEKN